ncbi:MAG TPA: ISL3 family transposase, partial [Casimicrobiaceae bacterium]|nr:ISL3 family transposase [Casimicrobiaceae bacterium]
DDRAQPRGRSYGTIVVDSQRHRVVDRCPDHSASLAAVRSGQRPGIAVVARDRSIDYASGLTPARGQQFSLWLLTARPRR